MHFLLLKKLVYERTNIMPRTENLEETISEKEQDRCQPRTTSLLGYNVIKIVEKKHTKSHQMISRSYKTIIQSI